jgi:hypothetical protein|tara:strand:+ start:527 stop:718 length:192 start_codon:yes stop_codon:yes gene_type:complete
MSPLFDLIMTYHEVSDEIVWRGISGGNIFKGFVIGGLPFFLLVLYKLWNASVSDQHSYYAERF